MYSWPFLRIGIYRKGLGKSKDAAFFKLSNDKPVTKNVLLPFCDIASLIKMCSRKYSGMPYLIQKNQLSQRLREALPQTFMPEEALWTNYHGRCLKRQLPLSAVSFEE